MKIRHVLCMAAVLTAGCGTGTTANSPVALPIAPQTVAQRDLLTLLPDTTSFPDYLEPVSDPSLLTLDSASKNPSAWNGLGTLIPGVTEYEPVGCTPIRTPDMISYASGPFAWQFHLFESKSRKLLPTEAGLIGAAIGRGQVDEASVRALTTECAIVRTPDGVFARYEILPNPKSSSTQVLAIKTEAGLKGGTFRLTYVAQVDEYVVTTYALCGTFTACEKEIVPVFQNAVSKAATS